MWFILLVVLSVHSAFVDSLAPLYNTGLPNSIPNQYIVVLHPNTSISIRDAHIRSLKYHFASGGQRVKILNSYHIGGFIGFAAVFPTEILNEQLQIPNVMWIEQDTIVTTYDTVITQNGVTWGIDRISQRYLPLDNKFNYWESAGTGTISYVIDTGIRTTHNEFEGRAHFGTNTIGDGNTEDQNGHGTHVAGTIGGVTYGVAKKTTLISVIVLNGDGSGTVSSVSAGIDWVASDYESRGKPKSVANLSLGLNGISYTVDNAVSEAINAGVNFAIAAGNSNSNACNYSPARVAAALTVGATSSNDYRASFSNVGSCVDLFAPGDSITSAWKDSDTSVATLSGTSMASPHVAGAVALHLGHITTSPSTQEIHNWFNDHATYDVVTDANTSPNRFLYSPPEDL